MTAPRTVSHEFPGTIEAASAAESWLLTQSNALGLAPDSEFALNLCLEELFLNAVRHGRASRTRISISATPDAVQLEFVDDGAPFDPTVSPGRIRAPDEDVPIGGHGTGLLRKFSRRMTYGRNDGHNRLVVEFDAISGPPGLSPTT